VRIEKPDGMAVEFINPPPDVRDSLQRYINGIVDF